MRKVVSDPTYARIYQRQPSPVSALASSAGTASSPRLVYAVRQSGLIAFSIACESFDSTSGGTCRLSGTMPRPPACRFEVDMRVPPGSVPGTTTSRRGWKMLSSRCGVPKILGAASAGEGSVRRGAPSGAGAVARGVIAGDGTGSARGVISAGMGRGDAGNARCGAGAGITDGATDSLRSSWRAGNSTGGARSERDGRSEGAIDRSGHKPLERRGNHGDLARLDLERLGQSSIRFWRHDAFQSLRRDVRRDRWNHRGCRFERRIDFFACLEIHACRRANRCSRRSRRRLIGCDPRLDYRWRTLRRSRIAAF